MLQWLTHIGLRVTRKYKKITILLQIGFHHIIECPMCTTTLLLTMYYYLELLKYLTWSVSVSTQQQNVYKTTRKFPCTNMQAFLKWWLSFQYRTTPIFFSFRVCFQKRYKNQYVVAAKGLLLSFSTVFQSNTVTPRNLRHSTLLYTIQSHLLHTITLAICGFHNLWYNIYTSLEMIY